MKTQSLPSPRPGLRFVLYPDHEALHITDELQHLELVGARVPFGTQPASEAANSWIESCASEPGFRLITMSMDGLLVGFVAGSVREGLVHVEHLVLASSVRRQHPELIGVLAEMFVEAADQPWADVEVPSGSPALGHLLTEGWRPTARTGAAVAAAGDTGHLVLSAAGGR